VTAEENIRAQLAALLEQGSLPRSVCGSSLLRALKPLLDSGVIVEERFGAGRRLAVRDPSAAKNFFLRRYPDDPVFAGASSRVVGVARFRDTKALATDETEMVCLRAWSENVLFRASHPVDVAAATAEHGVFAFLLDGQGSYTLRGLCALVENPAVFACLERLKLPVGLAIYGHGRVSNRLIDWLTKMTAPDFTLLHLPDYDPAGLNEFARLRARLGKRVSLHQPADLAERFARHSNRGLLAKANQQAVLAKLRRSQVPEVRVVLELIDRHNAGLEHEALLL
jgi:hypothetical protein